MKEKLRVWWNPQVGSSCDTFYVPVKSVEEGKKVMVSCCCSWNKMI